MNWTQRQLPATANWRSVTYGNGLFVAVTHNSNIAATSPDGVNWTQRQLPATANWQSVTYGNGMFVAVGYDNNIAATLTVGPTATHADATLTSSNGFSLIDPRNPGGFGVSNGVNGIAAYKNDIPTVPGTQIPVVVPPTDGGVRVIWGAGRSFPDNASSTVVPVGEMSWTMPGSYTWTVPENVYSVCALTVDASGGDVSFGDLGVVENGFVATQRSLPAATYWLSVTYGNGLFVAVASNGNTATSPDGVTWTQRQLPATAYWYSVTYGNGMFVAVATNSIAATSPDGVTWTQRSLPAGANWNSVTYGNGLFVAVATNENIAATSPDGVQKIFPMVHMFKANGF